MRGLKDKRKPQLGAIFAEHRTAARAIKAAPAGGGPALPSRFDAPLQFLLSDDAYKGTVDEQFEALQYPIHKPIRPIQP